MKIAFIGKFNKLHDEEYIARSFEMLGHEVVRISQSADPIQIDSALRRHSPDILLYTKWEQHPLLDTTIRGLQKNMGMKTICWLFDLYFDYPREWQVRQKKFFRSDYVFTTDGGHAEKWKELNVNHQCVRQGIYLPECYTLDNMPIYDVVFVGIESPLYPERNEIMKWAGENYGFKWLGRKNSDEVRGERLNDLYSRSKIVIGNSVYSPYYWSNRIVETLGRGGFLIHQDVEGLKEEYPHLVTYKRGDLGDLKEKIDYYLSHEDERKEIVRKNHEWVFSNYTMDKKCAELISKL